MCRFSAAGDDDLTTRSGGRRLKTAKARTMVLPVPWFGLLRCLVRSVEKAKRMRRREFIAFIAGAAIACPRATIAQAPPRVFRLGTLTPTLPLDEKNPLGV